MLIDSVVDNKIILPASCVVLLETRRPHISKKCHVFIRSHRFDTDR